uniref:Uncharacterized protein n=1 Tax=Picea sitchensis TaxID=3332 RepID=A0A6B9XVD2_PICSI|nr:hypothetical protein Q903MT_gene6950 [Picea sitchensis]
MTYVTLHIKREAYMSRATRYAQQNIAFLISYFTTYCSVWSSSFLFFFLFQFILLFLYNWKRLCWNTTEWARLMYQT